MLDPIGEIAVRTLGVDIANLSARLAVQVGVMEMLIRQVDTLDPSKWTHEPVTDEEGSTVGFVSTIPGEEMEKLQQILSAIQTMK